MARGQVAKVGSPEVKVFRVVGKIIKPNYRTGFRKEFRATKPEEAVERVYREMGSRHRAKRFQIKIVKVEEVNPEKIESPTIMKLTFG